jgi:hypothetical protein
MTQAPASLPSKLTSSLRSRPVRVAALGVVVMTALAACEKPSPGVTVWSGTTSRHAEATCWSFDGSATAGGVKACTQQVVQAALTGDGAPSIPVGEGNIVGISVDPSVAENGWYPNIGTSTLVQTPITSTYYRFAVPSGQSVPAKGLTLSIVAKGSGQLPRGVWIFKLVPATN